MVSPSCSFEAIIVDLKKLGTGVIWVTKPLCFGFDEGPYIISVEAQIDDVEHM